MSRLRTGLIGTLALSLAACSPAGEVASPPMLTAQGFDIAEVQEGALHDFGDLKVRIEAPAGIEELRIRERSYEVDLARSPEASHFPLFGLPARVWSKVDVTLNVGPYVDAKLDRAGDYSFEITVQDRRSRMARETVRVRVRSAEPARDAEEAPVESEPAEAGSPAPQTGEFRMQRIGPGPVTGAEAFGIDWKTIESADVVIRMRPEASSGSRLARLEDASFAAIRSREDLARALGTAREVDSLELATARDAAAGRVFAVLGEEGGYVLHTDRSATSLSELGTTVRLEGRFMR